MGGHLDRLWPCPELYITFTFRLHDFWLVT